MKKFLGGIAMIPAILLVSMFSIVSCLYFAFRGKDQWQQWIAVDQNLNAFIGGWADETISARSYRMEGVSQKWGCARRLIDALFWYWEQDHCEKAYLSERDRTQSPPEERYNPIDEKINGTY